MFFQLTRQETISRRREADLKLFNPSSSLQEYNSKTPPFASLTNEDGVAEKINEIVTQLTKVCPIPYYRAKVHH
jgi:hypothetical protein